MRHNLIDRLKEEWAQLDPIDPLRGLISDAIDALAEQPVQHDMPKIGCVNHDCDKCKAQQQEPDTPKFVRNVDGVPCMTLVEHEHLMRSRPPASKPWVGLTMDEITKLWDEIIKYAPGDVRLKDFAYAIEAKLREKNA